MRKRTINICLEDWQIQSLDQWAKEHGISRSSAIALAIGEFIKKNNLQTSNR